MHLIAASRHDYVGIRHSRQGLGVVPTILADLFLARLPRDLHVQPRQIPTVLGAWLQQEYILE